ncbi:hypothetical protein [Pseudogemmobacter humi]|uniref:hypothetical protein n=1 Tax=Pseudogemmobacter humi TaxID=2483812 RepID=UPI000F52BAA6|nr:hypothetical protein [Pseudogemmobacter humi]
MNSRIGGYLHVKKKAKAMIWSAIWQHSQFGRQLSSDPARFSRGNAAKLAEAHAPDRPSYDQVM